MTQREPGELFVLLDFKQQAEVISARIDGPVSRAVYDTMVRAGARGWTWSGNPPSCHMPHDFREWVQRMYDWATSLTEDDKAELIAVEHGAEVTYGLLAKLDQTKAPITATLSGWLDIAGSDRWALYRPIAEFLRHFTKPPIEQ